MLAIGAGANSWLSALSVLFFVSIGNAPSVSCGLYQQLHHSPGGPGWIPVRHTAGYSSLVKEAALLMRYGLQPA